MIRYKGEDLLRVDHLYNSTAISERGLELAIAQHFLNETEGSLLEIGNVLQHYEDELDVPERRIVDLYEVAPGVENIDLFQAEGSFDRIVTISTLEHVGQDYGEAPDETGTVRAVEHLRGLLAPGGAMLVTLPLGWRPLDFESFGASISTYFVRVTHPGHWAPDWEQYALSDIPEWKTHYGEETPWASCVWVGEFFT